MRLTEILAAIWIGLALFFIVGNTIITYQTGVTYSGEPNYDQYHETSR